MLDTAIYRHAAYYAPPQHARLAQLGAQWLGRCAQSKSAVPQPDFPHISAAALREYTAAAARYGWHATLKAPFALQSWPGQSLRSPPHSRPWRRAETALTLPPLALRNMGDYLALVPDGR